MTTSANGTVPPTVRAAAAFYLSRGALPTPCKPRDKVPILEDWPDRRLTIADLDAHFPLGAERNVGLLLGEASNNLLDVDLDIKEAATAAPFVLPATEWISGRASSPRSHWWYVTDVSPTLASQKYYDLDNKTLLACPRFMYQAL